MVDNFGEELRQRNRAYSGGEKVTSDEVASIAAQVLRDEGVCTMAEARALAASCLSQAERKSPYNGGEQHEQPSIPGLPVAGYKPTQPPEAIAAVNVFKELEERALRHIESLDGPGNSRFADPRLLATGRTQLQGAFMFLARAVFQPGRVKLPEDEA